MVFLLDANDLFPLHMVLAISVYFTFCLLSVYRRNEVGKTEFGGWARMAQVN